MKIKIVLSTFAFLFNIILNLSASYHANAQTENTSKIILSISPMQQKNYDIFTSSIQNQESLKSKTSFIQLFQKAVEAIKINDYSNYIKLFKQLKTEYKLMNQNEKDTYQQLLNSVPNPRPTDTGLSGVSTEKNPFQYCYAICTFGSCAVSCFGGSPTCTCSMGLPECFCGDQP